MPFLERFDRTRQQKLPSLDLVFGQPQISLKDTYPCRTWGTGGEMGEERVAVANTKTLLVFEKKKKENY